MYRIGSYVSNQLLCNQANFYVSNCFLLNFKLGFEQAVLYIVKYRGLRLAIRNKNATIENRYV